MGAAMGKRFSNMGTGSKPRVSVIMPVYNTRQDWLDLAISSILGQTFKEFELIIIDNGSDEATQRRLSEYQDERIILLRLDKNMEAAVARNEGLKIARGEYIALMDSDDISLPERFEKQVEYMESHPDIGVLGACVGDAHNPGKIVRARGCLNSRQIECHLMLVGNVFCASTLVFRAEVLRQMGEHFSPDFFPAEDFKLLADLIGKTSFAKLDERLVLYRFHSPNCYEDDQKVLSCRIQAKVLCLLYGVSHEDALSFVHALYARPITDDPERLCVAFRHIFSQLTAHGYQPADVMAALQLAVGKIFYRTKSLRRQLRLFRSSLGREFHVGLFRRVWCLLTRGILSF